MGTNWRIVKTTSFVVIAFTAAALLEFGGISLEDKVFNFVEWKWLILAGQGYLAWAFKNLINF